MSDGLFAFSRSELVEQHGYGVADVVFDNQQELLWVAGQKGTVTSYYSCGLELYTKFPANSEVTQLLSMDPGVLSLSPTQLNLHTRQGIPQMSFKILEMCCMAAAPNSSCVILGGGNSNTVTKYDMTKRCVQSKIAMSDGGCVLIKETPSLTCLGSPQGNILLYDKNTNEKTFVIEAHSGTISDFDISDNMLVSCGFAKRGNQMEVKRSLLVYDLRMRRSLNAVHCNIDPIQLKFMPMYHSQVLIASQSGQFQQLEVTAAISQNTKYFDIDLGPGNNCYAIDLSSTSKALAIGDTAGMLHLLASQENTQFNTFSQHTYFPTESALNFPKCISIDDYSFPLATVPFPHTTERLLSDWPVEFNLPGDRRPKPLDPEVIKNMRMVKFVGYSPNPNNMYKNTIPYDMTYLQQHHQDMKTRSAEDVVAKIPRIYHRITVDPNTLTESDLHNLNRTKFSVLYTTKKCSYICSILQLLYFMEPICLALKSHICQKARCLACELGVLFYTLDITDDKVTNADAFLNVFEHIADNEILNSFLLPPNPEKTDLLQLPQALLTFLLRHLDKEIVQPHATSSIFLTFGSKVEQRLTCASCQRAINKTNINLNYSLNYGGFLNTEQITFHELLRKTMQREVRHEQCCNLCGSYSSITDSTILESLPYILQVNCGMQSVEDVRFWQKQIKDHNQNMENLKCSTGRSCQDDQCKQSHNTNTTETTSWLPLNFHIMAGNEQGELIFKPGLSDDKSNNRTGVFEYQLCAVVAHIDSPDRTHGLILHSLVNRNYHQKRDCEYDTAWYLFNGCSATSTSDKEGVSFGQPWKTPCVLIYKQIKLPKELFQVVTPNPLDVFAPFSIIPHGMQFIPLGPPDMPSKGELVGMGVEVLKDNQACLIRVVLVRGQGANEGVPFSYDICPTNFSPEVMQNQLTSLKLLYFKIKCLVDKGIILVGHNISKQLKYLNIHIPSKQHIDTAELYSPKNSGMMPPLSFLCTRLLKVENLPGPNNDACYSLQLYEKFLELKRAGQFERTLKSIHESV